MAQSRPIRFTNWYLRDWMSALGVKQSKLCERTGWSKAVASLLYNDRQDYSPTIVRDAALALHIHPYELFMHPDDAMAIRQLRKDALKVVETTKSLPPSEGDDQTIVRTGTRD